MFLDAVSSIDPTSFVKLVILSIVIALVIIWMLYRIGGDNIDWS